MKQREPVADAVPWKAAVTDLFGGGWTFAWVGPREHDDWRRGAVSVMSLKAVDPRGWNSVNHAPEVAEDRSGTRAPFIAWSPEQLKASLYEISPASATQFLTALKGEWHQAASIPNFKDRWGSLFSSSRKILSRFGPSATFFTNASDAWDNPNVDLRSPDAQWECLSVCTTDCGLVVVSDTEVGVFWAFWED